MILRPTEAQRRDKPLLDDETRAAVYGAVLRSSVEAGAPITNDLIVKPGERDFLRVVLTEGHRAIAIPVKTGGASAGLLVPGDQVDVILTQKFSEKDERMARRSVAETVAEDLRVLAIDEPKGEDEHGRAGRFRPHRDAAGDAGTGAEDQCRDRTRQIVADPAPDRRRSPPSRPMGGPTRRRRSGPATSRRLWARSSRRRTSSPTPASIVMRGDKSVQVKLR